MIHRRHMMQVPCVKHEDVRGFEDDRFAIDEELAMTFDAPEQLAEVFRLTRIVPAWEDFVMPHRSTGDGQPDCRLEGGSQVKGNFLLHQPLA